MVAIEAQKKNNALKLAASEKDKLNKAAANKKAKGVKIYETKTKKVFDFPEKSIFAPSSLNSIIIKI